MCARPVQASVTVMAGHEKVRNSSKDSKNTPHERSYLSVILSNRCLGQRLRWSTHQTMLCSWKWPMYAEYTWCEPVSLIRSVQSG